MTFDTVNQIKQKQEIHMSTGRNFLNLRQNSKRRSIGDVGSVKVHKKCNDRNYKSRKYRKHIKKRNRN